MIRTARSVTALMQVSATKIARLDRVCHQNDSFESQEEWKLTDQSSGLLT
jgi:hypothetical protein